jgi:hypothetical protein
MSTDHTRLIAKTARAAMVPLGFRQRGRSRLWYCDHGWWAEIIEFQPSAWSKGSYLNIAAMWLWQPGGHWAFNESRRVATFCEYQDEARFSAAMTRLASLAASETLKQRQQFDSIDAAARYVIQESTPCFWQRYHAAVFASISSDHQTARTFLEAVLAEPAVVPWMTEVHAKAVCLSRHLSSTEDARALVAEDVQKTRAQLGLAVLPGTHDLWSGPSLQGV